MNGLPGRITKNGILGTVLGTLFVSFGTAVFILPFGLITGGVSGASLVLDAVLPFDFITPGLLVTVISWSLFFLGLIVLGRDFALKTLVATLIYPTFVSVFTYLTYPDVLGGYFSLAASNVGEASIYLAAVFGGVFVGLGCSLTFLSGGSSGGMDILAFIIVKLKSNIKASTVILIIDTTIILLGAFVTATLVSTLLGVTTALITALLIDKLFIGSEGAFSAYIVSAEYEKINSEIINKLSRTATILEARGGFSGKKMNMLFVNFNYRQYSALKQIVYSIDRHAFLSICRAHEINGEGWSA